MAKYIERKTAIEWFVPYVHTGDRLDPEDVIADIRSLPAVDVAPVVRGHWMLAAHKEKVNCRWNVTAECSNCCSEPKEIWAGFFPNVPDWLARDVVLQDAEQVKLSEYCPDCGAKMKGN